MVIFHLACFSSVIDFFSAYLSHLCSTESTADLCARIVGYLQEIYPVFKNMALKISLNHIIYADESPHKTWELEQMPKELLNMIHSLTVQTFGMDFFSSILDFLVVIKPLNAAASFAFDIELDIICLVDYILQQPKQYWTRFYSQGRSTLLNSYLNSLKFQSKVDIEKKLEVCFYLMYSLLPGQEVIASKILFSLFKHLEYSPLSSIAKISDEHKMMMLDIYDKNFYSDSSLQNS